MSVNALTWARRQRVGSPTRKFLLVVIADRAKEVDGALVVWAGQEALATDTELSARSVRRELAALERLGLIEREQRRRPDGYRTSDMIRLNVGAVPASPATESADTLSGDTVAASSDQDEQAHRPGSPETSPATDGQAHRTEWPRGDGKLETEGTTSRSQTTPARGKPMNGHSFADEQTEEWFRQFWDVFPFQVHETRARRAFRQALGHALPDVIIEGASVYAQHVAATNPQFMWHPDKWLAERMWTDSYEPNLPTSDWDAFLEDHGAMTRSAAELGIVGAGTQSV